MVKVNISDRHVSHRPPRASPADAKINTEHILNIAYLFNETKAQQTPSLVRNCIHPIAKVIVVFNFIEHAAITRYRPGTNVTFADYDEDADEEAEVRRRSTKG